MNVVRTSSLLTLLVLAAGTPLHSQVAPNSQVAEPDPVNAMVTDPAKGQPTNTDLGQDGKVGTQEGQRPTVPTPPVEARTLAHLVAEHARATTEEISSSLDRLHNLVAVAIGLSVVSLLFNAAVLLRIPRKNEKTSQDDAKEILSPAEPPSVEPLRAVDSEQAKLPQDVPLLASKGPPPVERIESSQPPPPSAEPDEFAGLPHAAMGRVLSQLHQALPSLARKLSDPRQQERFLAELDLPLKARVERFKEATRRGDAYLKEHWIEQDLVTTLNTLAQMLSAVIEERYRGRRGNRPLEQELSSWLYEKLAPVCSTEGWFTVESVLPFMTRFDPKIHHSVGSVAVEGADNLIVAIKGIGRRDARQGFVIHKAEVLVGR